MPKKAIQAKLPTLPPTQVSQLDFTDKKRKQDQKGKEVVEKRRNFPSKEAKVQRRGKHARVVQTKYSSEGAIIDRRGDHQTKVPA